MQAHILAHFINEGKEVPNFPFLCLTVSGGHTQIVKVESPLNMQVIGTTLDDAAGEAFDKSAKILGLPYLEVRKLISMQKMEILGLSLLVSPK